MQQFSHPKYSILYGTLMISVVGSGQEWVYNSNLATTATWLMLFCGFLLTVARLWMTNAAK